LLSPVSQRLKNSTILQWFAAGLNGAGELGREALAEAVADEVADRREGACGDIQGCGQVLGVRTCYTRMTPVESKSAIPRDARSVSDTVA
jgi:hypothetical protein